MTIVASNLPTSMTVDQFLAWDDEREIEGRFELHDGRIVEANSERYIHSVVKHRIVVAFERAIERGGLPCVAVADGMAVAAGNNSVFEPDAQVHCGPPIDDDALLVPGPVVVVEVLSPSTRRKDIGIKMTRYFLNQSIQHYLMVVVQDRKIVHHKRMPDGNISTRIIATGDLVLDPPGLVVPMVEVFPPLA